MSLQDVVTEKLLGKVTNIFGRDSIIAGTTSYFALQFDATYLNHFTPDDIAEHVVGFMIAKAKQQSNGYFYYESKKEFDAFFFCGGSLDCQQAAQAHLERFVMDRRHLNKERAMSIRSYHAQTGTSANNTPVVLLTVEFVPFRNPSAKTSLVLEEITTDKFLRTRPPATLKRYQNVITLLSKSIVPVYTINRLDDSMLALKMVFIPDRLSYLSALTTLLSTIPNLTIAKKFVESFSNDMQVYTFYVRGASPQQLEKVATTIGMLPNVPQRATTQMYNQKLIDHNEVIYCHALTMFAYYFTPPHTTEEFTSLKNEVKHNPTNVGRLKKIRNELFQEIMSEDFILECIRKNVGLFKQLYQDFANGATDESWARLNNLFRQELRGVSPLEQSIWRTFLLFNKSIVKCNFFKVNKGAVSFRLNPAVFMKVLDYPRVPYTIYMIVGAQFRGFHVRFTEIARGGVRMILSPNPAAYNRNKRTLFVENYNLAYAQLLKNKDIPEGGSKGTILVSMRSTLPRETMFLQYVDSLLDLMVPTPGVRASKEVEGKTEILFLGPDEHTAGAFPKIAAMHAKGRGYTQWKSFTTGKSQDLGGIPHDMFGMTSRGVRQYVECIYEKLGLTPSKLTKFQTGGPDGDLGSNEILFANENYVALVDGSGSLFDPEGINKAELARLAKERKTLKFFDAKLLSKGGFFVSVSEKNRTLPDGTLIEDGESFRNRFHFSKYCVADTFVPCGGRPASISLSNVDQLVINMPGVTGQAMIEGKVGNLAGTDKLRFKYIVEGANLFITHDARIALENVGVVLIKDSSANKGGVSCSSLEVLSGLMLTDSEHAEVMCVKDGVVPDFYTRVVDEIIERIRLNARKEFDAIWREKQRGAFGGVNTLISDALSSKIVAIRQFIYESDLFEAEPALARYVIGKYTPATMLQKVPVAVMMDRVPKNYLRAIFSIWIASDFVYTNGTSANDFAFFKYMHNLTAQAAAASKASKL